MDLLCLSFDFLVFLWCVVVTFLALGFGFWALTVCSGCCCVEHLWWLLLDLFVVVGEWLLGIYCWFCWWWWIDCC